MCLLLKLRFERWNSPLFLFYLIIKIILQSFQLSIFHADLFFDVLQLRAALLELFLQFFLLFLIFSLNNLYFFIDDIFTIWDNNTISHFQILSVLHKLSLESLIILYRHLCQLLFMFRLKLSAYTLPALFDEIHVFLHLGYSFLVLAYCLV